MENLAYRFQTALEYGVLGAHAKLFPQEYGGADTPSVFLRRAVNHFSALNILFGTTAFPEHPHALFRFLARPLEDVFQQLPPDLAGQLAETGLQQLGAMLQWTGPDTYYVDEDGQELLKGLRFRKIQTAHAPVEEYIGQKLYLSMVAPTVTAAEYSTLRGFLTAPNHAVFPRDSILQTPEEAEFCRKYPQILGAAYLSQRCPSREILCCPACGAALFPTAGGSLRCAGSIACNDRLNGTPPRRRVLGTEDIWVLNTAAVHNIYCPGQLERKIHAVLEKERETGRFSYELWPEKDRLDVRITFSNGVVWGLDAKMVRNPHWIISDAERHRQDGFRENRLFYIVPNRQHKHTLRAVRENLNDPRIECLRLNEFADRLREEVER